LNPPFCSHIQAKDLNLIECNRETGEHVEVDGVLQYIPFLTCKETSKPLALKYLSEEPLNCTIESLSDETYHLWEFYVHHDSPMACRVPARPFTGDRSLNAEPGAETNDYIPFGDYL